MMRIVVMVAAVVAALGLVACGGDSSTGSSSESGEVARALKLIQKQKRLEAMYMEGVMRAGAMEGGPGAQGMEEAAEKIGAEADEVAAQINAFFSNEVQRRALAQL